MAIVQHPKSFKSDLIQEPLNDSLKVRSLVLVVCCPGGFMRCTGNSFPHLYLILTMEEEPGIVTTEFEFMAKEPVALL